MNPILSQLLALTAALEAAAGATAEDLAELRRWIAAILFQQNPGNAVPADPAMDPAIAAALEKVTELVGTLSAAGVLARFEQANELAPSDRAEQPSHVLGPLADQAGNLSRFPIFQTVRSQSVHVRLPNNRHPKSCFCCPN